MPAFTVTEPHPTVAKNSFMHSGRGGAGNFFRAPLTTDPAGVPTTHAASTPKATARFYSGRGGAGNFQTAARTPLSFEEEYTTASHHEKLSSGHVGRGGAGNVYGNEQQPAKKSTDRRESDSSDSSSLRTRFLGRLSGTYTH